MHDNSDEYYDEEDDYYGDEEPRFEYHDDIGGKHNTTMNRSSNFGTILDKVHEYVEDELYGRSRAIIRTQADSVMETTSKMNNSTMNQT